MGRIAPFYMAFLGTYLVLSLAVGLVVGGALIDPSSDPNPASFLTLWSIGPMFVAAAGVTWAFATRVDNIGLAAVGLPGGYRGMREMGAGLLLGAALMGAIVLVCMGLGWLSWEVDANPSPVPVTSALWLAFLLFPAAFSEELLFRGYPFMVLQRAFGIGATLVVTSVLFGLLHWANPGATNGVLPLVNLVLAGVLLGVAYWRTQSLWFATGLHYGWNVTMAATDLPVSGLEFDMHALSPSYSGPEIWTGGGFGPEGGMLTTIATILGTMWLLRLTPATSSQSPTES